MRWHMNRVRNLSEEVGDILSNIAIGIKSLDVRIFSQDPKIYAIATTSIRLPEHIAVAIANAYPFGEARTVLGLSYGRQSPIRCPNCVSLMVIFVPPKRIAMLPSKVS